MRATICPNVALLINVHSIVTRICALKVNNQAGLKVLSKL